MRGWQLSELQKGQGEVVQRRDRESLVVKAKTKDEVLNKGSPPRPSSGHSAVMILLSLATPIAWPRCDPHLPNRVGWTAVLAHQERHLARAPASATGRCRPTRIRPCPIGTVWKACHRAPQVL